MMHPLKKKSLPSANDNELDQMYIDRYKHECYLQLHQIGPVHNENDQLSPDEMISMSISFNFPTEGEQL